MLNTVKKAADRLFEAATRADASNSEPLNVSIKTSLDRVRFSAQYGHLIIEYGEQGLTAFPLEAIKNPSNKEEITGLFRRFLSDLRQMEEHRIFASGQLNQEALEKLKQNHPYILKCNDINEMIYFDCVSNSRDAATLHFKREQDGGKYTEDFLELQGLSPNTNISLFSLPGKRPLK